jgi:hypothetical protein|tara:strand:- start:337 stop:447 length:111 start_codon:yes stop_codon:yes gene_type:complete
MEGSLKDNHLIIFGFVLIVQVGIHLGECIVENVKLK